MTKQDCLKSVCVDKSSYKITKILLDELCDGAEEALQEPYLEIFIKNKDNEYYKLRCKVEKVRM